jgi:hypothetical protein
MSKDEKSQPATLSLSLSRNKARKKVVESNKGTEFINRPHNQFQSVVGTSNPCASKQAMYKKERYYRAKKVYLNVVHNNTSNHIWGV